MPSVPVDSWRRDLRPRVFAIVFSLVALLLVALIFGILMLPTLVRLDAYLSEGTRSLRTPALTSAVVAVTRIADVSTMLVLVPVTALVLWLLRRRSGAILLLLVVVGGHLMCSLMQVLLHRARPVGVALIPLPDSYSFPSGHATAAFLYFGCLSFIALGEVRSGALRYGLVALFAILGIAVGLSRVYLGVHYFFDVIAGWLLGGAVLVVAMLGYFAFSQPNE
jgi:membrane-associated phospholipid phosphatase